MAGAAVHGRVKRSRHRGALAGAKAPGANETEAFDEAAGERGPRREGIGDDPSRDDGVGGIATDRRMEARNPVREGPAAPKVTSYDSHRTAPIQISRPLNGGLGNGDGPHPILLHRAGDIAVNEELGRGDATANAEASNKASTLSPSMKVEESNDPQVLGRSVGLQKSTGRILRISDVRKGTALR